MRKVYLAARYSRRVELCMYRDLLLASRWTVTSRWLDGNHQVSDSGLSEEALPDERRRLAEEDYYDVVSASVMINFTETPRSSNGRGGRHVEFGLALGLGRHCVVVGPRENVFHCLPRVHVHATFDTVIVDLEEWHRRAKVGL